MAAAAVVVATVQPLELSTLTPAETTATLEPTEPTQQPPAARVDPEEFMLGENEHVPAPSPESDPQP